MRKGFPVLWPFPSGKRRFLPYPWISFLAVVLLLDGCARLPHLLPQAVPSDRTGMAKTLALEQGRAMTMSGVWPGRDWWKAAGLHGLDLLMHKALLGSPGLREAGARILAASAAAGQADARLFPHFHAQADLTEQYFSRQGLHTAANGTENLYGELDPLVVHYHMDLWGQDRYRLRAALASWQVARADHAEARLLLSRDVAMHYFALLGDAQQLRQEVRREELERSLWQIEQIRLDSGIASAHNSYAREEAVMESRQEVAALRESVACERHILARLVGQGPDWGERISAARWSPPARMALPLDLPLRLVLHRPDIAAARWEMESAAARVGAARAAFYPDVNLALFSGWNSIHLGDLFSPGNLAHAVGPEITLPIFEGHALRSRLKAQNARYQAAGDHYRRVLLRAVQQVANALSRWQEVNRQLRAQERSAAAANHMAHLAVTAYDSGIRSRLAPLRSQATIARIGQHLAVLQAADAEAWAGLETDLGGGYVLPEQNHPKQERK